MELLDRGFQRDMLRALADKYPNWAQPAELGVSENDRRWDVNLTYLSQHDLVDTKSTQLVGDDDQQQVYLARITARGLDFLADDGGLGAILGVVTVRLDAESLRAIIGEHLDANPAIPEEQRSRIKGALRTASSEVLKEATKRLVGYGIDHAPEAIQLLQRLLG